MNGRPRSSDFHAIYARHVLRNVDTQCMDICPVCFCDAISHRDGSMHCPECGHADYLGIASEPMDPTADEAIDHADGMTASSDYWVRGSYGAEVGA